jgi:hypothetical protein
VFGEEGGAGKPQELSLHIIQAKSTILGIVCRVAISDVGGVLGARSANFHMPKGGVVVKAGVIPVPLWSRSWLRKNKVSRCDNVILYERVVLNAIPRN